jgi:tetratricopeptide (TPR) repeat protein
MAQAMGASSAAGSEVDQTLPMIDTPADVTGDWSPEVDDPTRTGHGHEADKALSRGTVVRYFGDYEILKELGRGGMGVVYQARQVSLNRPVALKMVKAGLLAGDDDLRRFRNEAEAVALLDHPGIVPVYEVGEHQGQHYFSMKLLQGGSLVPRLPRYQDDPRAAALLVAEAAEAVAHAHMRGILHRDLKPANILVDDAGHPHVTDFGLAKKVEADVELTQSGAILGTPAYMSPEQASGRRGSITTATDVYGLGAVLYALLTGKAPFGGDSLAETLDAVRNTPPEPPTRTNAKVPRDLETICLKCLDKDPRRRYPHAQALADDLRAWLDSRPITARRVGPAERAWLWCKRSPAIAGLTTAVALAVVGGTAAVIAVQAKANADLREANAKIAARYQLALDAIQMFHTGVSEDFLLKQDQFKDLRDRLLKSAVDFYGKLGKLLDKESDLDSRRALLRANSEVARLTGQVGRVDDAMALLRRVVAERERLAAGPGALPADKADLGRDLMAVAGGLDSTGQTVEAEAHYRRAGSLLTGLPPTPEVRATLARCRSGLGWLLAATGRVDEAQAYYRQARVEQEALVASPKAPDRVRFDLALTILRLVNSLSGSGRLAEARAENERALALLEGLADTSPSAIDVRRRLADSRQMVGGLLLRAGKFPEADGEFREALALRRKLVNEYPAINVLRDNLVWTYIQIGHCDAEAGRLTRAEAEFREALAIGQRLVEDNPRVAAYRLRVANSHNNIALVLKALGKGRDAVTEYREALSFLSALAEEFPDLTSARADLAQTHTNLGMVLRDQGRLADAEIEQHRAIEALGKVIALDPENTEFAHHLANGRLCLADLLGRSERWAEAETELRDTLEQLRSLAASHPEVRELHDLMVNGHHDLGTVLRKSGRAEAAEAEYRRSLEILGRLAGEVPDARGYRSRLASTHHDLGIVRSVLGDLPDAEAEFRAGLAIRQDIVDDHPNVATNLLDLADSHADLAVILQRQSRKAAAELEFHEAIELYGKLARDAPGSDVFRRRLARALLSLGWLLAQQGRTEEALELARREEEVWQVLVHVDKPSQGDRDGLANCLTNTAELLRRSGKLADARDACERAMALREALVEASPREARFRGGLAESHLRMGQVVADSGDPAGAADRWRKAIERFESLGPLGGEPAFFLACCHAGLSGLATPEESRVEAEKAMALLRRAVATGHRDPDSYRSEDVLSPLRDLEDFRLLLLDLAMPTEPFAVSH